MESRRLNMVKKPVDYIDNDPKWTRYKDLTRQQQRLVDKAAHLLPFGLYKEDRWVYHFNKHGLIWCSGLVTEIIPRDGWFYIAFNYNARYKWVKFDGILQSE